MAVVTLDSELVLVGIDDGELVVCMTEDFAYKHARLHKALWTSRTWAEIRASAPAESVAEVDGTLKGQRHQET